MQDSVKAPKVPATGGLVPRGVCRHWNCRRLPPKSSAASDKPDKNDKRLTASNLAIGEFFSWKITYGRTRNAAKGKMKGGSHFGKMENSKSEKRTLKTLIGC